MKNHWNPSRQSGIARASLSKIKGENVSGYPTRYTIIITEDIMDG
ncbi:MAG TPA: hypothetical protein PLU64_03595 [Saprospiraceae bacterium]|nr:hypothetical protein [Saprospiraceae bacterium]